MNDDSKNAMAIPKIHYTENRLWTPNRDSHTWFLPKLLPQSWNTQLYEIV